MTLIDTAEMYPVPARRETFTTTETIIGHWFAARPGVRQRVVLATKVAGPSRGMDWVRGGSRDLTPADIDAACHDSLRRLRTDVIDLYQIHWPNRNAPSFGAMYFDPAQGPRLHVDPRPAAGADGAGAGRQGARTSGCRTKRRGA